MVSSISVNSGSVVPYNSELPISLKANLAKITDEVARRSLEGAKFAVRYFPQIPPRIFTGRNFYHLKFSLTTPKTLAMDTSIGIDVFSAASGNPNSPIFIFSHGYGVNQIEYWPLLGELASHGYTVLSLTHPSSVKEVSGLTLEEENKKMDQLAEVMANNIHYVIKQVREGPLKHLGCADKIYIGGHSLGGAAAVDVAKKDAKILGCVDFDGFLKGKETDKLEQPVQLILGDYTELLKELSQNPEKEAQEFAEHMTTSLKKCDKLCKNSPQSQKNVISGATHMDFTVQPFLEFLNGNKTLSEALRVHRIASHLVLDFLGSCLSPKPSS
jgi:predicted esterase